MAQYLFDMLVALGRSLERHVTGQSGECGRPDGYEPQGFLDSRAALIIESRCTAYVAATCRCTERSLANVDESMSSLRTTAVQSAR